MTNGLPLLCNSKPAKPTINMVTSSSFDSAKEPKINWWTDNLTDAGCEDCSLCLQVVKMVRLTEDMIVARTRVSDMNHVKKLNCWSVFHLSFLYISNFFSLALLPPLPLSFSLSLYLSHSLYLSLPFSLSLSLSLFSLFLIRYLSI